MYVDIQARAQFVRVYIYIYIYMYIIDTFMNLYTLCKSVLCTYTHTCMCVCMLLSHPLYICIYVHAGVHLWYETILYFSRPRNEWLDKSTHKEMHNCMIHCLFPPQHVDLVPFS